MVISEQARDAIREVGEVNILVGTPKQDLAPLFCDLAGSDRGAFWLRLEDDGFAWPQLLKELGVFSSTSQARKAGWNKEIPEGFSDLRVGKRKLRITILKEGR